jgi:two-component system sensor histidine kinase MprB
VTRLGLTLRSRIALLVAVTVGFAVALVALAAYVTMRMELAHQLDHSLLTRADQVVELQQQFPQTLTSTPSLSLIAADVDLCFVSAQYPAQCTDAGLRTALGTDGPELAVAQGKTDQSIRTLKYSGERYRVVAVSLGDGAALVLAGSAEQADATLDHLGLVLLVVGSIGVVFSAGAGLVLARASVRPVERLTAAVEHVARTGELEPIEVQGHDELGRLAVTFNAMLAALEISRTRQQQLVADAGHELRTPLTSLRTNLDLLAQSEATVDRQLPPEDRAALLADVRAQAEELSGLVADLVELARDDAPSSGPEAVDFAAVVERAVERVRRRAVGLQFDVALEPWTVHGESAQLERAVTNVLDNAVKWSPPDGSVGVRLSHGRLDVADSGPGVEDADLPHVFDRFYRSPTARAMPGSGLGLSIVRQAAERHGGSVSIGRARTGGALVVLELPGYEPGPPGEE